MFDVIVDIGTNHVWKIQKENIQGEIEISRE